MAKSGRTPLPRVERFLRYVAKGTGCWLWTGSRDKYGYGNFSTSQPNNRTKKEKASRVMYEMCFGEIPSGMQVCHTCDNPPCVCPDHLFLGTVRDNALDMVAKGRARNQNTGKTHCKRGHELTADNVYRSQGKRTCRTCNLAHHKRYRTEAKAA